MANITLRSVAKFAKVQILVENNRYNLVCERKCENTKDNFHNYATLAKEILGLARVDYRNANQLH